MTDSREMKRACDLVQDAEERLNLAYRILVEQGQNNLYERTRTLREQLNGLAADIYEAAESTTRPSPVVAATMGEAREALARKDAEAKQSFLMELGKRGHEQESLTANEAGDELRTSCAKCGEVSTLIRRAARTGDGMTVEFTYQVAGAAASAYHCKGGRR